MANEFTKTLRKAWAIAKDTVLHPATGTIFNDDGNVVARVGKLGQVTLVNPPAAKTCPLP